LEFDDFEKSRMSVKSTLWGFDFVSDINYFELEESIYVRSEKQQSLLMNSLMEIN